MNYRMLVLLIAVLTAVVSLGAVLRAYGMPTEARTSETWLSYQSQIAFDFSAGVLPGPFYAEAHLRPEQLVRTETPTVPPDYRRVLISQFVEKIDVKLPYQFQVDRPASLRAKLRVEGEQVLPGIWQKPYHFVAPKEFTITGTELSGTETFTIPVRQFITEMETNRTTYGFSLEPLELHIRPVLEVSVDGLRQPITVVNDPEFVISMRSGTVEVEEPRAARQEKMLIETMTVPATVSLLGENLPVGWMRQAALAVLGVSLALATLLLFINRRTPAPARILAKLGPDLIRSDRFDPPPNAAVADVGTVRELLMLQSKAERPVIRVGNTCYLLDGTTCYRHVLAGRAERS